MTESGASVTPWARNGVDSNTGKYWMSIPWKSISVSNMTSEMSGFFLFQSQSGSWVRGWLTQPNQNIKLGTIPY